MCTLHNPETLTSRQTAFTDGEGDEKRDHENQVKGLGVRVGHFFLSSCYFESGLTNTCLNILF